MLEVSANVLTIFSCIFSGIVTGLRFSFATLKILIIIVLLLLLIQFEHLLK